MSGVISGRRRQKGECGIVTVPEQQRRRYFAPIILAPLLPPLPSTAVQEAERKLISRIGILGDIASFVDPPPRRADAHGAHDSRGGYNSQYYNEAGSGRAQGFAVKWVSEVIRSC